MHILHIIKSVDPRTGGPIEGIFRSIEVWQAHGHSRDIVSLDSPDASWVANAPTRVFALGSTSRLAPLVRRLLPWTRYGYNRRLRPWLIRHGGRYDCVVINGLWNYASFGGWRGLRAIDAAYGVFTHGMLDPWFNTAYPLKTFFKRIFWRLFEHRVLRDAACVLFTTEEEMILARNSFRPYRAVERVIGYGTTDVAGDPEQQRIAFFEACPSFDRSRPFMLFLGRLHEKKGVDLLVRAFAAIASDHPDLDLVVAGPDNAGWGSALKTLADQQGIADRVHWPGMLSGDAKWGAFREARVFVLPSHQENFGIVVAEALACSTPVLLTDKVNTWREVVASGGGLVFPDTVEGVTEGLTRFCGLTPEEREKMRTRARACFLQHYDLSSVGLQLFDVLNEARRPHTVRKGKSPATKTPVGAHVCSFCSEPAPQAVPWCPHCRAPLVREQQT